MTYGLFLQLEGDDDGSHIADRIVRVASLEESDNLNVMNALFDAAMKAIRQGTEMHPNELDT